jgi:hypothetical protein
MVLEILARVIRQEKDMKGIKRTGGMAQDRMPPCKHKALSSNASITKTA